MHCPKCISKEYVRSGFTKGKQRYKCRQCKCNSTQSHRRGAPLEKKLMALRLYLEGMGFRAIGRILKVNNVTVLNWIRTLGKSVKVYVQTNMPDDIRHIDIIELDEMWHFTKKKNGSFGFGLLSIAIPKKSLRFPLAVEGRKPTKN